MVSIRKIFSVFTILLLLVGCSTSVKEVKKENNSNEDYVHKPKKVTEKQSIFPQHSDINDAPVPLKIERVDSTTVNVEMTSQITDIEIDMGVKYKAWTFNGQVPGPLVVVNEGDTINFTLKNHDPVMPHSMDFHAVHTAPTKGFVNVMPNDRGTFTYKASYPGVFMYHCGTQPILMHVANGMHGTIIVKPKNGYPTDNEVDKEFVLIQNEWYLNNKYKNLQEGEPTYVVFSTKSLNTEGRNTNGDTFSLQNEPLVAKVGDKVRLYVNNIGPNEVSSFHVVGTVLDSVYIDGNPANKLVGLQTIMLPASGGAVVEFTVKEEGSYPILTHQLKHASKGGVALLQVTQDGKFDPTALSMSH
ncbi:MAG: nirK [Bacillales bacterium]|jgi:nitrite reductase (NO-forming)|nr:nirK [Bacillales bacterium]